MTMPFSSFRISSQSYYNSEANTSDCSAVPCILAGGHEAEQRRIVSDVQPTVGKPPGNVIAISGQDELDGHFSCDNDAKQIAVCDRQVIQKFANTAFPETLRKTSVMKEEGGRMFTEASVSPSSISHGWKGVSRPLYGRLRKHKGQLSSFSSKKSKRTMSKRRYSDLQNYCVNNSGRQQRDEEERPRSSEDIH